MRNSKSLCRHGSKRYVEISMCLVGMCRCMEQDTSKRTALRGGGFRKYRVSVIKTAWLVVLEAGRCY